MSTDREEMRTQIETSLKLKQCAEDIDKIAEKHREDTIKLEALQARVAELEALANKIEAGSKASLYIIFAIVSFIGWVTSSFDNLKGIFK